MRRWRERASRREIIFSLVHYNYSALHTYTHSFTLLSLLHAQLVLPFDAVGMSHNGSQDVEVNLDLITKLEIF